MFKKNSAFIICILILLIFVYEKKVLQNEFSTVQYCQLNKKKIDQLTFDIGQNLNSYKKEVIELPREATDGSSRIIYTDQLHKKILQEDTHSGETGYRVVNVYYKSDQIIKIIDKNTNYTVPPIINPELKPTISSNEFYIENKTICEWYKDGIKQNYSKDLADNYLKVIDWIIQDASIQK